jgi:phosphate transport system protein
MTSRFQFDNELQALKLELIQMGDAVIENIKLGLHSFLTMNVELAQTIILKDKEINAYEQRIEKDCLRIILKEQPVAKDLRLITAILKMITDLERIGDHAADISKMTIFLERTKQKFQSEQVNKMTELCQVMIKEALDSFIRNDQAKALEVIASDDAVDDLFEETKTLVAKAIRTGSVDAEYSIYYMMVAKYLERIGDHAVNLGEWVIFSLTGAHKNNLIF